MLNKNFSGDRFKTKFHVKTGDKVIVISGSSKGQSGTITRMIAEENRAVVEGVNMVKKHVKPTENNPGGIVDMEAPIHVSKLMHIEPKSGKPSRIGRRKEADKTVRYYKKSGETIK